MFKKSQAWLDEGYGACLLKHFDASQLMANSLHHFDGQRYELGCYVVMPNHVHVVVRPTDPKEHSLDDILKSWKAYTAVRINELLHRTGEEFWQSEGYDRIIRDEEHLWRVIQYIGRNPRFAGLPEGSCPLWIRPEWARLGWRFECES